MGTMSWREERDALIAQTLAFVQSVTGKSADFSQLAPAVPARPPVPGPSEQVLERSAETTARPEPDGADPGLATAGPSGPAAGAIAMATPDAPAAVSASSITGHPFTSITSQLGLQRDMQAEIRARVASFRENQERFNRERQEYFSSTLARLRASMNDVHGSDK